MIPAKAVEAAARAIYGVSRSVLESEDDFSDEWATWEQASERKRSQDRREARAALEAAAASIRADALEAAAEAIDEDPYADLDPFYAGWLRDRARKIKEEG